jgi:hypothetical protein
MYKNINTLLINLIDIISPTENLKNLEIINFIKSVQEENVDEKNLKILLKEIKSISIKNLNFLKYFPNVETVTLDYLFFTLGDISTLNKLKRVIISKNCCSNELLSELKRLQIKEVEISDSDIGIGLLSGPHLKYLKYPFKLISKYILTSINLETLIIGELKGSINHLQKLTKLVVTGGSVNIDDISQLKLKHLDLYMLEFKNSNPIPAFNNLEKLKFSSKLIISNTFFENLKNLRSTEICILDSLEPLKIKNSYYNIKKNNFNLMLPSIKESNLEKIKLCYNMFLDISKADEIKILQCLPRSIKKLQIFTPTTNPYIYDLSTKFINLKHVRLSNILVKLPESIQSLKIQNYEYKNLDVGYPNLKLLDLTRIFPTNLKLCQKLECLTMDDGIIGSVNLPFLNNLTFLRICCKCNNFTSDFLPNLREFCIIDSTISFLKVVAPNLIKLELIHTTISKLDFDYIYNLNQIDVIDSEIEIVENFPKLKNIHTLKFDKKISTFKFLINDNLINSLTSLTINSTYPNFDLIVKFKNLEELNLDYNNKLENLNLLEKLIKIRILKIRSPFNNIDIFCKLPYLEEVYVNKNKKYISDNYFFKVYK